MLASGQLGVSFRVTFLKNVSMGLPLIASHLKKEYAPGSTDAKPKKDWKALSGVCITLYS